MRRGELQKIGAELVGQARALRDADPVTCAGLPVRELPSGAPGCPVRAALACLRAEMLLVRDGRAGTLRVLGDELASVERALAAL